MSCVLLITYLWLRKDSANDVAWDLQVNKNSVTDWFSFCREVCVRACFDESEPVGVRAKLLKLTKVCLVRRKRRRIKGQG